MAEVGIMRWKEAVRRAIVRACVSKGSTAFSFEDLRPELGRIVVDTGSRGKTPDKTMQRELQELRNLGEITFVDNHGHYKVLGGRIQLLIDVQEEAHA